MAESTPARARLVEHLASRTGRDLSGLTVELLSGGRSNLTYRLRAGGVSWILRRPPDGPVVRGAHDVLREHRVMAALLGSSVPVPVMVDACDDPSLIGVPFYVMEEVPGVVLRTPELVAEVQPADRGRLASDLVSTLVALHETDIDAVGLRDLGRPAGYLLRQVDRWDRQLARLQVRQLDGVDVIVSGLRTHLPAESGSAIVHGDYRIDNVIVSDVDPGAVAAVLDWEMATLGDPLADLAGLVMFWDEPGRPFNPITNGLTALPGFPSSAEVIDEYAAARGLRLSEIGWYLALAEFKLAVLLEQIHARHLRGETPGDGFHDVGEMVPQLLDEARRHLAELRSGSPAAGRP